MTTKNPNSVNHGVVASVRGYVMSVTSTRTSAMHYRKLATLSKTMPNRQTQAPSIISCSACLAASNRTCVITSTKKSTSCSREYWTWQSKRAIDTVRFCQPD